MQASTTVVSDTKGWRELKEEQDERIKEKREQEEIREKELSVAAGRNLCRFLLTSRHMCRIIISDICVGKWGCL